MLFVPDGSSARGGCASSYLLWNNDSSRSRVDILDELQLGRGANHFASAVVQVIDTGDEILSVLQGEVAAAQPGDGPTGLGSDSATTCHIVGFRNPSNGRTCLAHLDNADRVKEALETMLILFSTDEGVPLDAYIVGGYLGRSCAEEMSAAIFSELHASPRTFRVVLACASRLNSLRAETVGGSTTPLPPPPMSPSPGRFCATPLPSDSVGGDIGVAEGGDGGSGGGSGGGGANSSGSNTVSTTSGEAGEAAEDSCRSRQATAAAVVDQSSANAASNALEADKQLPATADGHGDDGGAGWLPRRTSLAINLASGEPFPCRFEGAGRGPAWEVRYSRMFACGWKPLLSDIYECRSDTIVVAPFPLWINPPAMLRLYALPDQELLSATSTSPEAEADTFVADIRSCISYVLSRTGPQGDGWLENVFGEGSGAPLVYPRVAAAAMV